MKDSWFEDCYKLSRKIALLSYSSNEEKLNQSFFRKDSDGCAFSLDKLNIINKVRL